MNLRVIALVTAAISAERLARMGERVAQTIGIVVVAVGLLLIARVAAGFGIKSSHYSHSKRSVRSPAGLSLTKDKGAIGRLAIDLNVAPCQ
jgi:hypothetical protein